MPGVPSGTPMSVPCTFVLSPPIQIARVAVVRVRTVSTPRTRAAFVAKVAASPPWATKSANAVRS